MKVCQALMFPQSEALFKDYATAPHLFGRVLDFCCSQGCFAALDKCMTAFTGHCLELIALESCHEPAQRCKADPIAAETRI